MKKIALDIHGVIDAEPEFFSWLSHYLSAKGWEIHVVTGGQWKHNMNKLHDWDIYFDHFFSITDHHIEVGTPQLPGKCDGDVCVADELWDCVKGYYCDENEIDLIIDDTPHYEDHMPHFTEFVHW